MLTRLAANLAHGADVIASDDIRTVDRVEFSPYPHDSAGTTQVRVYWTDRPDRPTGNAMAADKVLTLDTRED